MSQTVAIDTNQLAYELNNKDVRCIELSVVGRDKGWFIAEGLIKTAKPKRFGEVLTSRRLPKRYANLESIYRDVKRVSHSASIPIVLRINESPKEASNA